ncbi:thioesterase [Pikeienuella piscinae]|uniref:Thioesterase n=1 Tax=Pikeienuella piscinae TaxID=2748098 RepID=A0A7L5C479_9RHOB|nr:thioesterase family protein [Pikeienuella piscinae]QIE57114.1 thioesterase [Pikeienuella piscinae]
MLELRRTCPGSWVDFNGHMRDAYYMLLVSFANDRTMDELGMGPRYLRETGRTLYNLDMRVRYLKEAHRGDRLLVEMRLLAADAKRLHLHSMIRNETTGAALAAVEAVLLHVDQAAGPAAAPFPPEVAALIAARLARDAGPAPAIRTGGVGLTR